MKDKRKQIERCVALAFHSQLNRFRQMENY